MAFSSDWCYEYAYKIRGQYLDMPTLPFVQNFWWAFVWMEPVNVPAKFEVRSFIRSWNNWGTQKCRQSLDMPTLPFLQNF